MKNKLLTLPLVLFLSFIVVNGQNNARKANPVGIWKFEAPNAPESYSSGSVTVGLKEKNYTAYMVFSSGDYKYAGEKVKFDNDTLSFTVYLEGQEIVISLKMAEANKMSGKAVYSEGEVPITLNRAISGNETKLKTD